MKEKLSTGKIRVIKQKGELVKVIAVKIEDGTFGSEMSLEDFVKRVCFKYGNPAMTFTTTGHTEAMLSAAASVISEMKAEAISVMHKDFENAVNKEKAKEQ